MATSMPLTWPNYWEAGETVIDCGMRIGEGRLTAECAESAEAMKYEERSTKEEEIQPQRALR